MAANSHDAQGGVDIVLGKSKYAPGVVKVHLQNVALAGPGATNLRGEAA